MKDHSSIFDRFAACRAYTEQMVSLLAPEDVSAQPISDVSPPKWHLGHTTWFFETLILQRFANYSPYNVEFPFLFNSYYESLGDRILRTERGQISRPLLDEVLDYRAFITNQVLDKKGEIDSEAELLSLLELGINHEQQHQELLWMDMKYILGSAAIQTPVLSSDALETFGLATSSSNHEPKWLEFDRQVATIGHQCGGFCYDNELPAHDCLILPFAISDMPVSNGTFLQFIEDEGYSRPEFWLSDGWEWVQANQVAHPLYWSLHQGSWSEYTLTGNAPLELSAPVRHISYYEADAFATWCELRLPTEIEWELAAPKLLDIQNWEWTKSAYLPYPGFKRKKGALGEYNAKFMVNQMVLRGNAVITPKSHSRPTYRNFFQPEKRWQFSGLRLAKDL